MQTLSVSKASDISLSIQNLLNNGGPQKEDYDSIIQMTNDLAEDYKSGFLSEAELQQIQNLFPADFLENTLQGHSFSKPYGYAGDFMIIDKVYREQISPKYQKWDTFFNQVQATQAVRNRKDYFKSALAEACIGKEKVELLNLASGPARDLLEFYQENPQIELTTDCIEYDQHAIDYAQSITKEFEDKITFIKGNVLRYRPAKKYDVVWSAGLFDYFSDEVFVKILRRAISWTKIGGEIIIGNFTPNNPSRNFMEILLDWHLHHRDENHLTHLAQEAGAEYAQVSIGREPAGVNLFLHLRVW